MNIIKHMSKGRVVVSAVILILVAVIMFCILKPAVGEDVDFLYGCRITPCIRYENTLYYCAPSGKEGKAKLSDEWSPAATIKSASSDMEAELEELQGNNEKMIGCKLWTCESDEDWIYLQSGGRFFRFVIEPCKMDWICYNENLYLLETHHDAVTRQIRISGINSSILPPDYVSLGLVQYEQIYRVPTKDLCSNYIGILNKEVFYNPQNDRVLYLAIPAGLAGKDGVPITRYDMYIKTADKSDWLKRGDGSFVLT